uniref:Uncharacterized protein n=1 Tax=Rhizophora mucronata TaxID=61149 RepID=A0A2P2J043_RHIMU
MNKEYYQDQMPDFTHLLVGNVVKGQDVLNSLKKKGKKKKPQNFTVIKRTPNQIFFSNIMHCHSCQSVNPAPMSQHPFPPPISPS